MQPRHMASSTTSSPPCRTSRTPPDDAADTLATQYADSLAGIPNGPFKTQGIAAGNAAADGDDRGPPGRRPLRALAVGAEHRPGALVAAD